MNTDVTKRPQNWISEADILRGFAILGVIAIHVAAYFSSIQGINDLVLVNVFVDNFAHYAVPLFILVSGVVLAAKYKGTYSLSNFYQRRFNSVIPQYLIFTAFYILFIAMLTGNIPNLSEIVYYIITASAITPLWFFAVIIQFYLFYPYLAKAYDYFDSKNKAYQLLLACLAIQLIYGMLRIAIDIITVNVSYHMTIDNLMLRFFPGYLFYFMLGIYVGRNLDMVKKRIERFNIVSLSIVYVLLTVVMSSFWIYGIIRFGSYDQAPAYYSNVNLLIDPFAATIIFIVLYKISRYMLENKGITTDGVRSLGKYSFGIYLVHSVFLIMIPVALGHLGIAFSNWLFYPIMFLLTTIFSYLLVVGISYLPQSQYMIGTHKT